MRPPRRTPPATTPFAGRRRGFTLVELVLVLVIVSIVSAIALPKIGAMRDRGAVRSARQQVSSLLATARATAIRQGQSAQLRFANNTAWVTATPIGGGTPVPVGGRAAFTPLGVDAAGFAADAESVSILYDLRGMAQGLTATRKLTFTRNRARDSLCISRVGLIAPSCAF